MKNYILLIIALIFVSCDQTQSNAGVIQNDDSKSEVVVKLADSFGGTGMVAETIDQLDTVIDAMLETEGFFLADIRVAKEENGFPMIPSGAAHNEMILGLGDSLESPATTKAGMALV